MVATAAAPRVRVRASLAPGQALVSLHEVPAEVVEIPPSLAEGDVAALVGARTAELLRSRASDFIGLAETQRLLDELEQFAPATVRNVVPKPVSLTLLADVLRRLVEERISVRDLKAILEALSTIAPAEKDALNLTEYVRAQLRRVITFRLTGGASHLEVYLLDPILEDTIRRAVTRTAAGAFLTLAPQAARDVITAVRRAVSGAGAHASDPVVFLTQPDIRRFVRKLLETELPHAVVVSFAELLPEVALRPLGKAVPGA